MESVLLLNASYEPLNVCSWRRAIILLLKGKAEALEASPNSKPVAHTVMSPLVIRLVNYVKIPHKEIPLTRRNLMHRDEHMCQYCGKHGQDLTIDHVMPKSRGGKDTWDNVVIACLRCNTHKGNKTPAEAGYTLHKKPFKPGNFLYFELSKYRRENSYGRWQKYLFC